MKSATQSGQVSTKMVWAGRVIGALAALFLLFDGVIKVMKMPPAVDGTAQLGYPVSLVVGIGIIELGCLVLYLIPSSAVLGAILLTGYLGGAVASQLRIGAPLFSNVLFPIYVGLLIWGALYLRDDRLRALIPLRR